MHRRVLSPATDSLSKEPQPNTPTNNPQKGKTIVCHNGGDITIGGNPRSNKLRDTITPYVLEVSICFEMR